jgi:hypothetical protein
MTLRHGRTIIASVHQPRSSIYAMIDHLVGRCMLKDDAQVASAWNFALKPMIL